MTHKKHNHDKQTRKIHYRIAVCATVAIISGISLAITENHYWHFIGAFFVSVPAERVLDYLFFRD